jgi:hypothetical protein
MKIGTLDRNVVNKLGQVIEKGDKVKVLFEMDQEHYYIFPVDQRVYKRGERVRKEYFEEGE